MKGEMGVGRESRWTGMGVGWERAREVGVWEVLKRAEDGMGGVGERSIVRAPWGFRLMRICRGLG